MEEGSSFPGPDLLQGPASGFPFLPAQKTFGPKGGFGEADMPGYLSRLRFLCFLILVGTGALLPGLAQAGSLERALAGWSRVIDLTHPAKSSFERGNEAWRPESVVTPGNLYPFEALGTQVEAPLSPEKGGISVDKIPLHQLFGPAVVLNMVDRVQANPDYALTVEDLLGWERKNGKIPRKAIVLMRTGWGRRWPDTARYRNMDERGAMHFPGFSREAAEFLLAKRWINGIGIDTPGLDPGASPNHPVRELMIQGRKYQLKNLANLDKLPSKGAKLIVAPLPIEGGSGAPARVLAILP